MELPFHIRVANANTHPLIEAKRLLAQLKISKTFLRQKKYFFPKKYIFVRIRNNKFEKT